ncbi:MAG: ATP-binding cassette domain-containing protein [Micromonosporaceae bacterium]|nr:ATP-binding cassette domain-containing protein [Micromonosporaceae bacterium]
MAQPDAVPAVRLTEVRREFDGGGGVHGVSLDIRQGEFFSLLGPSGCGKTTTLRVIAGFERPDAGTVQILGRDVTRLDPRHRPTAMVFQRLALFPHMTVRQNVGFGLKAKRVAEPERSRRVRQALERVEMAQFAGRMPATLSGGQQQRVAVARALAIEPAVLLLDEPLAALDRKLRHQLQDELTSLQERVGTTFVFVTHDQEEALKLSDRIALVHDGLVEQAGPPSEIFQNPATRWAASFMGSANWLAGQVVAAAGERTAVALAAGPTIEVTGAHSHPPRLPAGAQVDVMVRPEHLLLTADTGTGRLPGTLVEARFMGSHIAARLTLEATGQQVHVNLPANGATTVELTPGRQVGIQPDQPHVHVYASTADDRQPTPDRAG